MPVDPIDLNNARDNIRNGVHTGLHLEQSNISTDGRRTSVDMNNLELADEIEAVNAIYSQTSLAVERASQDGSVRCRFHVPGTRVILRIVFSSRYPSERPQVVALNVFQRIASSLAQQIHETTSQTISEVFLQGVVCMFDVVERVREQRQLASLRPTVTSCASTSTGSTTLSRVSRSSPWRPPPTTQIRDISALLTTQTCAICLDEVPFSDVVHLPCNHHFCTTCLNDGFAIALKSKVSFTCCTRLIPLAILAEYTITPRGTMRKYETLLIERLVKNPLYCSSRSCRRFIRPDEGGAGGMVGDDGRVVVGYRSDQVMCPSCKVRTCVFCRRKMHEEGWCQENKQMKRLMEGGGVQVCGKCGTGVEKTG